MHPHVDACMPYGGGNVVIIMRVYLSALKKTCRRRLRFYVV